MKEYPKMSKNILASLWMLLLLPTEIIGEVLSCSVFFIVVLYACLVVLYVNSTQFICRPFTLDSKQSMVVAGIILYAAD